MLKTHLEPMITVCCRTRTSVKDSTILRVTGAHRRMVGNLRCGPERELGILILMPENSANDAQQEALALGPGLRKRCLSPLTAPQMPPCEARETSPYAW